MCPISGRTLLGSRAFFREAIDIRPPFGIRLGSSMGFVMWEGNIFSCVRLGGVVFPDDTR